MSNSPKNWDQVKGRIITLHGSITRFAQTLDCSTEAIRKAFQGLCPDVAREMEKRLSIDLGEKSKSRRKPKEAVLTK